MAQQEIDALAAAAKGLLYPSESDEPFEVVAWGKAEGDLAPATVRAKAGAKPSAKVEEVPLGQFFDALMQPVEGAPAEESPEKFKQLRQALEARLSGVKVFRVGKVNIDIYIVGKSGGGEWLGLKTKAVET